MFDEFGGLQDNQAAGRFRQIDATTANQTKAGVAIRFRIFAGLRQLESITSGRGAATCPGVATVFREDRNRLISKVDTADGRIGKSRRNACAAQSNR